MYCPKHFSRQEGSLLCFVAILVKINFGSSYLEVVKYRPGEMVMEKYLFNVLKFYQNKSSVNLTTRNLRD